MTTQAEIDALQAMSLAGRDMLRSRQAQAKAVADAADAIRVLAGTMATEAGQLAVRVGRDIGQQDELTATIAKLAADPPSAFGWMDLRGEASGLGYNCGTLQIGGSGLVGFKTKLGYAPELVACSTFVAKGAADDLDAIVGGPESLGDEAVANPSQLNLINHPGTQDWLRRTNGVTRDTWLMPAMMPAPRLCSWQLLTEIAGGKHRARFLQAGRRQHWQLDSRGHRLDRFLERGPVEPDQDTGASCLTYHPVTKAKCTGIFQACENNGLTYDEAINFYHDLIGNTYGTKREGGGFWYAIGWSPAHESSHVPKAYNNGIMEYRRMLESADIGGCSWHQDFRRIKDAQAARDMVWSTKINRNTPQVALEAVISQGKPLMCCEWSPRYEGPPAPWVLPDKDHTHLPLSQSEFFDFFERHRARVFGLAMLSSNTLNREYLRDLRYPKDYPENPELAGKLVYEPTDPPDRNVTAYQGMVDVIIERMSKRSPTLSRAA